MANSTNTNRGKNVKAKSTKPKMDKSALRTSWFLNHRPLTDINMKDLERVLKEQLQDRYQYQWSLDEYNVVEFWKPLSGSGFDMWIRNAAEFMDQQIRTAATFSELRNDKIDFEDLILANKVMRDGTRALIWKPQRSVLSSGPPCHVCEYKSTRYTINITITHTYFNDSTSFSH